MMYQRLCLAFLAATLFMFHQQVASANDIDLATTSTLEATALEVSEWPEIDSALFQEVLAAAGSIYVAKIENPDCTTTRVALGVVDSEHQISTQRSSRTVATDLEYTTIEILSTPADGNSVMHRVTVRNPNAIPMELLGYSYQVKLNTSDSATGGIFAGGRVVVISSTMLQPGATLSVTHQGTNLNGAVNTNCWAVAVGAPEDANPTNSTAAVNYNPGACNSGVDCWQIF